ncbi:MAG: winged helix-turn-helix domain-containing protein, partial [Sulfitobacter sp.]
MDTIWQADMIDIAGPKYKAVAETIRREVAQGHLTQGEKLPPVRDLAWKFGITPGTVARAYTILTEEGLLHAEVGRGTFVAGPRSAAADAPYVPIEIDAVPHNAPHPAHRVNMLSPVLPSIGQAGLIREALAEVAQDPPSGVMHYPGRPNTRPAQEAAFDWLKGCPLGP